MQCDSETNTSLVWAGIVAFGLLLITYSMISSRIKERKLRKAREKSLPFVSDNVVVGVRYDVQLSDGRKFENVELIGTSEPGATNSPLGGWEGLLVMRLSDGRRVFVRQSAIRVAIESSGAP